MDNKNNDKEYTFCFTAKPGIEELVNEKKETMDYEKEYKKMKIRYNKLLEELVNENYEKEYKKMQSRYNKLLEENKKMQKALVNLSLKLK